MRACVAEDVVDQWSDVGDRGGQTRHGPGRARLSRSCDPRCVTIHDLQLQKPSFVRSPRIHHAYDAYFLIVRAVRLRGRVLLRMSD